MSFALTNWGYFIDGVLPNFITAEEFNSYTASKYAGDTRIASNIKAVGTAIRNYCGWHVFSGLPCKFTSSFFDRRVADVRNGILIQLPAAFVTEITELTIGGQNCETYTLDPSGLVKVYNVPAHVESTPIVVLYTAGLSSDQMDVIKELTAQRVTHALASSYGVTSEAAGGVSITYNASWARDTGSTNLTEVEKEILSPYRVGGVF